LIFQNKFELFKKPVYKNQEIRIKSLIFQKSVIF